MSRRVFFSFHYKPDNWRASQVRNIGVLEGNTPVSDNALIGENTAGRKWIKYEIENSWNRQKGVLGIYIHNLEDNSGFQCNKGRNPFEDFTMKKDGIKLSSIIKTYNPPFQTSKYVYNYIKDNISEWVEDAINIRNNY